MTGTHAHIDIPGAAGAVDVACGLAGNGTPATPLEVAPAAGQEAWPWSCDVAANSTLKCDPDTGELWTPPEHNTFHNTTSAEFTDLGTFSTPGTFNTNTGWVNTDTFSIIDCREWMANATIHGVVDVTYAANTDFTVGFVIQQDGGAVVYEPLNGIRDPDGAQPGRRLLPITIMYSSGARPALTNWMFDLARLGFQLNSGEITINGFRTWISYASGSRAAAV